MEDQAKSKINRTNNPSDEIFADYSPTFRVYKNGRVDRLNVTKPKPASLDRRTGVESKDVIIFPETGVSVRLFNPIKVFQSSTGKKMPLIMYCHGSGFCSGSTFSPVYHYFLNRLSLETRAIIVSVEYRKATEHPLPVAYNDCWDALLWIVSHDPDTYSGYLKSVKNPVKQINVSHLPKEPWLESGKVDFSRLFLSGDSSGANVAHQVTLRAGVELNRKMINGVVLIQPFFWGKERIGDEVSKCKRGPGGAALADKLWAAARWGSPASVDDPWLNPAKDPNLPSLGCRRVLLCLAQEDVLRDRGLLYGNALKKSGWLGDVIIEEIKGEDHVFHLIKPSSPKTLDLMRQIQVFVNCNNPESKL